MASMFCGFCKVLEHFLVGLYVRFWKVEFIMCDAGCVAAYLTPVFRAPNTRQVQPTEPPCQPLWAWSTAHTEPRRHSQGLQ